MMTRVLIILAILLGARSVAAQPVVQWRPPTGTAGCVLTWNGSAWTCSAVSSFSTNNVIPKGNGTTLVASALSESSGTATLSSADSHMIVQSTNVDSNPSVRLQNDAQVWQLATRGDLSDAFVIRDQTAAVHRLVINTTGNIGVGDTTPDNKLTVSGNISTTTAGGFWTNEARTVGLAEASGGIQFRTNNIDSRLVIDSSGNATFSNNLAANGNATLGDSSSDSHVLNGATRFAFDSTHYFDVVPRNNHDVSLIASGGNIYIAAYNASNSTIIGPTGNLVVNSTAGSTFTSSATTGLQSIMSGTARTAGQTAFSATLPSTYDTTAGAITAVGVNINQSSSRSAGANDLVNNALNISVSGGQNNRGIRANVSGTGPTNYGALITSTATGTGNVALEATSTGAGTTNYGGSFSASGATTNVAVQTVQGSNYFNTSSGDTGVGYALGAALPAKLSVNGAFNITGNATLGDSTTADTHTVNGSMLLTYGGSNDALSANYNGTAQAGNRVALNVQQTATIDATAATRTTYGINVSNTATRSAGANAVTNIGARLNSSGAQVNIGLLTDNGANYLNAASGNTGVGLASSATAQSKLHVLSGTSPSIIPVAGTAITVEGSASPFTGLSVLATGHKKIVFGNATAADDGQIEYDAVGRDMRFRTASTVALQISSTQTVTALNAFGVNGNATIGDATSDAHTINGTTTVNGKIAIDAGTTSPALSATSNNVGGGETVVITQSSVTGTALRVNGFSSFGDTVTMDMNLGVTGTINVQNNLNVLGATTIGDATSDTLTIAAKINSNVYYTGSTPTATGCGTSPTITGNNERFKLVTGTGATNCTINFTGGGFSTNAPVCSITPADNTDVFQIAISTTAITLTSTPASATYWGRCDGWL